MVCITSPTVARAGAAAYADASYVLVFRTPIFDCLWTLWLKSGMRDERA